MVWFQQGWLSTVEGDLGDSMHLYFNNSIKSNRDYLSLTWRRKNSSDADLLLEGAGHLRSSSFPTSLSSRSALRVLIVVVLDIRHSSGGLSRRVHQHAYSTSPRRPHPSTHTRCATLRWGLIHAVALELIECQFLPIEGKSVKHRLLNNSPGPRRWSEQPVRWNWLIDRIAIVLFYMPETCVQLLDCT